MKIRSIKHGTNLEHLNLDNSSKKRPNYTIWRLARQFWDYVHPDEDRFFWFLDLTQEKRNEYYDATRKVYFT